MKSTKCDKTNAEFFIDMSGGSLETALQNFENFKWKNNKFFELKLVKNFYLLYIFIIRALLHF